MLLPREPKEKDYEEEKEEVKEEEEEEPSLNLHLIWDDIKLDDIDDDTMEEACVGNDYNLRSKVSPKANDYGYENDFYHRNIC